MDAGGTTPRMEEVEPRRERRPRATHGAVAEGGFLNGDKPKYADAVTKEPHQSRKRLREPVSFLRYLLPILSKINLAGSLPIRLAVEVWRSVGFGQIVYLLFMRRSSMQRWAMGYVEAPGQVRQALIKCP